jgi:hypothetical protein
VQWLLSLLLTYQALGIDSAIQQHCDGATTAVSMHQLIRKGCVHVWMADHA